MGYVDSQDTARARQREADAKMTETSAERAAAARDLNERGRGLFRDPLDCHLDEAVRVDLNAQRGHVPPLDLAEAQQDARAAMQPYRDEWRQATGSDMPVEVLKEILTGLRRGGLPDEQVAALREIVVSKRTPGYETRASREALLDAANADMAQNMPRLNALCKTTGVGNRVALASTLISHAEDRARAPLAELLRGPGKPAAVRLLAPGKR